MSASPVIEPQVLARTARREAWWAWSNFSAFMLFVVVGCNSSFAESLAISLSEARRLYLTGNYAEAGEMYAALADRHPIGGAIGQARCLSAVGKYAETVELLDAAAKKHPESGEIHAELARLALEHGDDREADAQVHAALELITDKSARAPCRWIEAQLACRAGHLDTAKAIYKSLVDLYNATDDIKDPDVLHAVSLAAAQHARWNRLSDQFQFLVNDFYPDMLKREPNFWQAHYESGLLFSEKFNQADASREFKAALAINPHAGEIYAAIAELSLQNYELTEARKSIDRALELNPKLLRARQLSADLELANFEPARAIEILTRDALPLDPHNEQTLGRLAAAYVGLDGNPEKLAGTRLGRLIDEVNSRNPHAGEFYLALGSSLEQLRHYPDAVRFYREAIDCMPELIAPRGQLGLVQMRLGEEVEADKQLRKSFIMDPFNVRVGNTLKVLDVLKNYSTIETEHFVVKFDRAHDELLAKYAADFLEDDVYPQLVKKFGFQPAGKSLFEIFSRAKNTDGHGWFSARMVGLPYIGTVGGCAGRMVAMQSPNDSRQKFNWSRVLRHEFVHVVNLQQTDFNIPHWFTEALAVQNEGYGRPRQWNELLARRLEKEKKSPGAIYNLKTINSGFIRPQSSDDWALAYCQAALYADYMLERFGADSLAKMLAAYAGHANTAGAIKQALGFDETDFESGYRQFLRQTVNRAGLASELRQDKQSVADDVAQQALDAVNAGNKPNKARELTEAVLAQHPRSQFASYCLARILLKSGDQSRAIEIIEASLDRDSPHEKLLLLLTDLKRVSDKPEHAIEFCELGAKKFPHNPAWNRALARAYLGAQNDAKLEPVLIELAEADPDDIPMRKKLTQIALDAKIFGDAVHWAKQCLYIDVEDKQAHRMLADALLGDKKFAAAVDEYVLAVKLSHDDLTLQTTLANAQIQAGAAAKPKPH